MAGKDRKCEVSIGKDRSGRRGVDVLGLVCSELAGKVRCCTLRLGEELQERTVSLRTGLVR